MGHTSEMSSLRIEAPMVGIEEVLGRRGGEGEGGRHWGIVEERKIETLIPKFRGADSNVRALIVCSREFVFVAGI